MKKYILIIKEEQEKDIIATVEESSQGDGYFYDIYNGTLQEVENEETDSIDGGLCTGSIDDAIIMALDAAQAIL